MEFSWTTWLLSVAAVVVSAWLAWLRGDLRKRPGLDMGFANHGGMWGDLLLLPVANAAIVPHLTPGRWIAPSLALSIALSMWVHRHWYRGQRDTDRRPLDFARDRQLSVDSRQSSVDSRQSSVVGQQSSVNGHRSPVGGVQPAIAGHASSGSGGRGVHSREHMWPSRSRGSWWEDLSWAGWAHVAYVAGELTLLLGFLLFPMPSPVVGLVCAIFTLHVPLGLLQPRWFLTGQIASPRTQPLLLPLLATLWVVALLKFQS